MPLSRSLYGGPWLYRWERHRLTSSADAIFGLDVCLVCCMCHRRLKGEGLAGLLYNVPSGLGSGLFWRTVLLLCVRLRSRIRLLGLLCYRESLTAQLAATGNTDTPCQGGFVSRALISDLQAWSAIWSLPIALRLSLLACETVVGCSSSSSTSSPLAWWFLCIRFRWIIGGSGVDICRRHSHGPDERYCLDEYSTDSRREKNCEFVRW